MDPGVTSHALIYPCKHRTLLLFMVITGISCLLPFHIQFLDPAQEKLLFMIIDNPNGSNFNNIFPVEVQVIALIFMVWISIFC